MLRMKELTYNLSASVNKEFTILSFLLPLCSGDRRNITFKNNTGLFFLSCVNVNVANTNGHCLMLTVKPNPPENISVQVLRHDEHEHLSINWHPPQNTDTGSGWVTIKYEVRVKDESSDDWKVRYSVISL